MRKKAIDLCFVVLVFLGLLLGLAKAVFLPKEMNEYENRYAAQFQMPCLADYADGSFQDSVESALNDQTPFAQRFKKLYNTASSSLTMALLRPVLQPDRYYSLGSVQLFSDWLTYQTRELDVVGPKLEARAEMLNRLFAVYPQTEFYVYYIEKDTDINFETGERIGADGLLFSRLDLPSERLKSYEIADFSEFSEYFYQTDHHWNYRGSYRAYRELLPFLGCGDAPIEPTDTETLGDFSGSKAAGTGMEGFSEPFTVYRFDFPTMDIRRNGEPAADYGKQDENPAENGSALSYGGFYGGDDGEVIFDTHRTDRENILLLGESYDNAVVKLLASHFGRTYAVDLRYYRDYMGKDFSMEDYLRENNISKVLLIGNIDYFISDDFALES